MSSKMKIVLVFEDLSLLSSPTLDSDKSSGLESAKNRFLVI